MSLRSRARMPRSPRSRAGMLLETLPAVPVWIAAPFMRPWHMRWGATTEEVAGDMPGDEVVKRAQFNATRAITIDAPYVDRMLADIAKSDDLSRYIL